MSDDSESFAALRPAEHAFGPQWRQSRLGGLNQPMALMVLERVRNTLISIGPRPILLARYILYRIWSTGDRLSLRLTYRHRVARPALATTLSPWPFRLPPASEVPAGLESAVDAQRREAENACRHQFDLLGSGLVDLGEQIDWHRDYKSGFIWAPDFYQDLCVTRLDDNSDAKVPWELSRGHQLLALARAACLFEESRYADELERQLNDWIDSNPPGIGINWVNTMEIGIRATNWVWAVGTVESWRPLEPTTRRRVISSLEMHGRHILANLEGNPQLRSNHYLGDILGLLAIGWALRADRHGRRWFVHAKRGFEREVRRQVLEDGVDFEASTAYHGLVMEMLLIARWLCATAGAPMSPAFDSRLTGMLSFSRAIRDSSGRIPLFGDNDSGRVLPAESLREPTHDHVLWLGSALLGRLRPSLGPPHPEVAWTLGLDAWAQANTCASPARPASQAFPWAGYYVLSEDGLHTVVRCGDVGQNGNGGHAHNDLLSFTLSVDEPVIVDPGTSAYTADVLARNEARSTRAHNSVVVEEAEINPLPHELFRLRQIAHPTVERWSSEPGAIHLQASHDGYRRLPQAIEHRRTWKLLGGEKHLEVLDELTGSGSCRAESLLHIAPSLVATPVADDCVVVSREGVEIVRIVCCGATGAVEVRDGWVSPSFGTRQPAPVIVARAHGRLPLRFGWTFVVTEQTS